MKLMLSVSRLSLAAAAVLAMSALPAAAQTIGVNAAIKNQVQMKTAADRALRPAVLREQVHLGDAVASGPNSALQVLLRDKSMFTVGANARMTFDRFVFDPDRGTSEVAASVAKGAFRFMSGKTQPNARKTINTPVASIGIRGTIVEGVVGSEVLDVLAGETGVPAIGGNLDETALIVLRGPSRKTSGFDTPGLIDVTLGEQTVPVEYPGQAILVANGQLFGPFDLSDAAFDRLSLLLRTVPMGPGEALGIDIGSASVASGDVLLGGEFGDDYVFDTNSVELPEDQTERGGQFLTDNPPPPNGP